LYFGIANELKTLKDEYYWATNLLDVEYKPADDVIKTYENLHVEEKHQLKILLQEYEHLIDGILGEFYINTIPFSHQLIDPNCKPDHVRAYLQYSKEIVRLVDIGVIEEVYSSDLTPASPTFAIPKRNKRHTIRVFSG
jgi:hypothetical protein